MSIDPLDFLDSSVPPSEMESQPEEGNDPLSFLGEDVSKSRSLLSAFPKGFIRSGRKVNPFSPGSPIPEELSEKILQQFLPTREGDTEEILEEAGGIAPHVLMGPESIPLKAAQALSGSVFKKGAKELELPEWAREIAGITGAAAPTAAKATLSKTLRADKIQKPVMDMLRNNGFSEREITPLIQNKKKMSLLSKAALKFEKESPFVRGIKNKFDNIYDDIRVKGDQDNYLEGAALKDFENNFFKKLDKIPPDFKDLIKRNEELLFEKPINFTSLHDFVMGVNRKIKGVEGGKAVLGILKEPVREAQEKLDAPLYKELRETDSVYRNYKKFLNKLTKKDYDNLIKWGPELGSTALGVITFSPALIKLAGAVGLSRVTAKQLLSNPRLQNIHLKILDSIKNNNPSQFLKLMKVLDSEVEKSFPDVSQNNHK